eukprot:3941644-Rhodomonas_salina.22
MQPLFQPWTLIRKTLLVVVARPDDLCWCCKVRIQQINAAFSKNVEPPRACKHIRHAMAGSDGGCQVDVMDSGRGYLSASYELETATQSEPTGLIDANDISDFGGSGQILQRLAALSAVRPRGEPAVRPRSGSLQLRGSRHSRKPIALDSDSACAFSAVLWNWGTEYGLATSCSRTTTALLMTSSEQNHTAHTCPHSNPPALPRTRRSFPTRIRFSHPHPYPPLTTTPGQVHNELRGMRPRLRRKVRLSGPMLGKSVVDTRYRPVVRFDDAAILYRTYPPTPPVHPILVAGQCRSASRNRRAFLAMPLAVIFIQPAALALDRDWCVLARSDAFVLCALSDRRRVSERRRERPVGGVAVRRVRRALLGRGLRHDLSHHARRSASHTTTCSR